ncbi:MAG: CPBP family intramembrane metalloprotease [Anaerolineaceae bacterium]|nr:CPBP family intramembrane metalloprotease [Anaerolineaceae bacterium]
MDTNIPQHSLIKSFLYHLLPGVFTALAFFIFHSLLKASGNPPLLAFLLMVVLVDLPIQLGILLMAGKKRNGRLSLQGILAYQEKLTWKKFTLIFAGAFVVIYALIMLITPINTWLMNTVFSGLPAWMLLEEQSQYLSYGKQLLIGLFTAQLVITGLILPWVEECYFRGFLLPRLSRFGKWAAVFSGFFFACYHVWQPQGFLAVLLLGTALAGLTLWQRDLRLPISLHVLANAAARLVFLFAAISM